MVKLKNGEVYWGAINLFRPAFGWFTLFGSTRKFYFDECESVVTPNERVYLSTPIEGETQDEMLRAKKTLDDGRKYFWTETDEKFDEHPYPKEKFAWEEKYELERLQKEDR